MELVKIFIKAPIKFYQFAISPMLAPRCRFYPTCSHYAIEAIDTHGVKTGTIMAAKRVLKCHPFSAGGIDLVKEG